MQAPELPWNLEALRHSLAASFQDSTVEITGSTGSTNTDLLERARSGAPFGACLRVAELQTAGRGRQGRTWHAERGASLTFSLAVPLARPSLSGLSLAVGAVLADALDPPPESETAGAGQRVPATSAPAPASALARWDPSSLRIGLKWPNDLYLRDPSTGGRKLGGVLIETLSAGAGRLVVIGIGLNLRRLVAGSDIPAGTAALDEIDPDATAPAVLERLVTPLGTALRRYEQNGFAAFKARFAARDLLAGRAVTSTQAGAVEGVAEGVDADGSLRVRLAGGMRVGISSGEVSVRLDRKALPC